MTIRQDTLTLPRNETTMATDTSLEMSFREKLGERFSSLTEGVSKLLMRLFGDSNERYIRKLGYTAARNFTGRNCAGRGEGRKSKPAEIFCTNWVAAC